MTPEARLDRLERVAKLFVKAALRARRNMREMDEKLNILGDLQIQNQEKFAKNEERFAKLAESQEGTDRKLADLQIQNQEGFAKNEERFAKLAESQERTDRKLADLIDIIRGGRNGTPQQQQLN